MGRQHRVAFFRNDTLACCCGGVGHHTVTLSASRVQKQFAVLGRDPPADWGKSGNCSRVRVCRSPPVSAARTRCEGAAYGVGLLSQLLARIKVCILGNIAEVAVALD
jgi:hypothetical protein